MHEIQEGQIQYPDGMDANARDLVAKLLQVNPLLRLGYGLPEENLDYAALKAHPFFNGLNF